MQYADLIIRVRVVIRNRLGYGISVRHNVSPLIRVEFEQNVDFTDRTVCTYL